MRFVGPISALLVLVTTAVFYPTLGHGFVSLDDYDFILHHPQVNTGPSLDSLVLAFTTSYQTSWHPLTLQSLMEFPSTIVLSDE